MRICEIVVARRHDVPGHQPSDWDYCGNQATFKYHCEGLTALVCDSHRNELDYTRWVPNGGTFFGDGSGHLERPRFTKLQEVTNNVD